MLFNIRVYGVLLNAGRVLLSDEKIFGKYYTKFPGGGLEYGEGTRDCLKREFKEETGLDIQVGEHIYTTDFFQPSGFKKNEQIISIYYFVEATSFEGLQATDKKFNFSEQQVNDQKNCEVFRWIPVSNLNENELSFPIDKMVSNIILEKLKHIS